MKTAIVIEVDTDSLASYTDSYIAQLWSVSQANPAPFGDLVAGRLASEISFEILRRWLKAQEPELYTHQGRHFAQQVHAQQVDVGVGEMAV